MDPVINALAIPNAARLLDVRMGRDVRGRYDAGHLEGAVFVDVERDLTGDASDPANGGRHPLPTIEAWSATLGRWGIRPDTCVVVYDDSAGAKAAARAWWMLRASGHADVRVLDGGLDAARAAGLPIVSEAPNVEPAPPYPVTAWSWPRIDADELEARRTDDAWRVLDVRAAERWRGEVEPYDPPGGRIAGARNVPLAENLDDGRFKTAEALRAQYEAFLGDVPPERLVVSCGSGITACHTLLALERAGLGGGALYVGSYSEWSRQHRATERGEP